MGLDTTLLNCKSICLLFSFCWIKKCYLTNMSLCFFFMSPCLCTCYGLYHIHMVLFTLQSPIQYYLPLALPHLLLSFLYPNCRRVTCSFYSAPLRLDAYLYYFFGTFFFSYLWGNFSTGLEIRRTEMLVIVIILIVIILISVSDT